MTAKKILTNPKEILKKSINFIESGQFELAKNPEYLKEIKTKLISNVKASSVYNIGEYTKSIESGYIQIYERYHDNLNPEHVEAV